MGPIYIINRDSFVRGIRKIIRWEFMAAFGGIHLSGLYIMLTKGKGRYKAACVEYIRRCGDNGLYHNAAIYYYTDDRCRVVGYFEIFHHMTQRTEVLRRFERIHYSLTKKKKEAVGISFSFFLCAGDRASSRVAARNLYASSIISTCATIKSCPFSLLLDFFSG